MPAAMLICGLLTISGMCSFRTASAASSAISASIVVLDVVMGELDKLIEKGGKEKKNSKLALTLINQKNVNIVKSIDSGISVDDVIVGYAQKNQCVVATQDLGLAGKLKLSKIPRILLRKKQFLVIETFK